MAKSKSDQNTEGLMNLREAAAYLNITDQRVRTVLREGRVEATKNEKGYWRVSREALDAYTASKGQRQSGAKAYVIRLNPEEKVWLEEQLVEAGFEVAIEPRYNYDPEKAKAYRLARAEKQAAEAEAEAPEAEA